MRFAQIPLDEEAATGYDANRSRRSYPAMMRWGVVAGVASALLCAVLYTAWHGASPQQEVKDLKGVEVKELDALEFEDIDEEDWPEIKSEIKEEQYKPAACFARLSFASAWSTSLGLKIRAAIQECSARNYRDDPTPFRRLHEDHDLHSLPSLPQEASVHYPASSWGQYMHANKAKGAHAKRAEHEDLEGLGGQSAYNLTGGTLHLKTLFAFGTHWTMEGWHYMKDVATRLNSHASNYCLLRLRCLMQVI